MTHHPWVCVWVFLLPLAVCLPSPSLSCPSPCSCRHRTVRCSTGSRALLSRLSPSTQHLYLSGSSFPSLGPGDLAHLTHLTSLSLANTGLTLILPGTFSQNKLLYRLDLSYNHLTQLDSPTLSSLPSLLVLKVNNNLLSCVDPALKYLTQLEVLSLQQNLLRTLPRSLADLDRLRQLRLDVNRLECSCGMEWLVKLLRRRHGLGLGTDCHGPERLAGIPVSTLLSHQLPCTSTQDA
jgi:Leucine-rich repeat (LRR) protein